MRAGCNRNVFRCGRTIEDKPVGSRLAVDEVVTIARVPDERIVASTEGRTIVTSTSSYGVVATAGEDHIDPS
jgi:hypothetical protein